MIKVSPLPSACLLHLPKETRANTFCFSFRRSERLHEVSKFVKFNCISKPNIVLLRDSDSLNRLSVPATESVHLNAASLVHFGPVPFIISTLWPFALNHKR